MFLLFRFDKVYDIMTRISLGSNCEIDLQKLIESRALVQASSGGGKSWILRRLLERSHGKVQQIVLDLEGEFSSLREKYDYILVGKDGDIPINLKTAEILARKLLEIGVSAIIDLYELKHHERILFVKRFIDSMVNAPKELWHPCLVVVDECHIYAPEKGESESSGAIIDLATRGRKRGYAIVAATQRLAKLNKDVAAECKNKLIGSTFLDIDVKRAADELGFTAKEQISQLRKLDPGDFFAYGVAFSNRDIIKTRIGSVETTHPKPGSRKLLAPTPPTQNIKAILSKLTELPKEAEKELNTLHDYKTEIIRLKQEVRALQAQGSKPALDKISLEKARLEWVKGAEVDQRKFMEAAKKQNQQLFNTLKEMMNRFRKISEISIFTIPNFEGLKLPEYKTNLIKVKEPIVAPKPYQHLVMTDPPHSEETKLSPAYLRMLKAAATFHPNQISRQKMSFLADVPINASTFRNGLSSLRTKGLVVDKGEDILITELGLNTAGDVDYLPSGSDLIEMWKKRLSPAYQRLFSSIIEAYPSMISREEIAQNSEVPLETSTFRNGISRLNTLGLIHINGREIKAKDELFE